MTPQPSSRTSPGTPTRWRLLAGAVAVAALLAACTSTGTQTTPTTAATTPTTDVTTTTTVATTSTTEATSTSTSTDTNALASGSGCTPGPGALPDGEWFGRVDDVSGGTLSFDLACWFTGDAAAIAAAEDGEESPPPNDYYIRNQNPAVRELAVAADVPVVFYPDGDPRNETDTTFADWPALADERGFYIDVWVTIEDGEVTAITEQWVP